ncbi:MAG: FkbM family methyltransferase [Bacteroidales bacterium]|nr:FkbM family methyltransferase [Bacteroidales bacterium]
MTLDNYVKKNYVKKIDLIKLDTEGTENIILSKSANILKEMKPIIICETLFNKIELELELIMRSYGYQFYNHIGNGLEKVDSIVRQKDNGVKNCFFVHPEKYHLIEEFEKQAD